MNKKINFFNSDLNFCKLLEVINSIIFIKVSISYFFEINFFFGFFYFLLAIIFSIIKFKNLTSFSFIFWILSLIQLISVIGLLSNVHHSTDQYLLIISLLFFSIQYYFLNSPLFFPKIPWWELDFRYRYDLKIKIHFNELDLEGRLVDYKKRDGCIISLNSISVGSRLKININSKNYDCTVITVREPNPGRGFILGIRFFEDVEIEEISKIWSQNYRTRIRKRFNND